VRAARDAARERWADHGWASNAEAPGPHLRTLRTAGTGDLDRALERGTLTLRGVDRVLRVAWTLADLAGRTSPGREEIGQALLLRTRGQVRP
jgi:magnesium chelatase family protein